MKKVTLDYDEVTGELFDNGLFVINIGPAWTFTEQQEELPVNHESKVKDLTSLKDAGFTAQEIMQMKREGLI